MSESSRLKKKTAGYGYKYTELADINEYVESKGWSYEQSVKIPDGREEDYIYTKVYNEKGEVIREGVGAKIIETDNLSKMNGAQDYGAGLTYARRYSLLLILGLATEDDDAESLSGAVKKKSVGAKAESASRIDFSEVRANINKAKSVDELMDIYGGIPEKLRSFFVDNLSKRKAELEGK